MADDKRLGFFAYETVSNPEREAQELKELFARLKSTQDISAYRSYQGVEWSPPNARGYTTINVLPELYNLPLCDLVLAYIYALRPSCVRISSGEVTCDAMRWRVTILVDVDDRIRRIYQEVEVGYGSGSELQNCLNAMKVGDEPKAYGGVIGHTAGLERVDFQ